MSGYGVQLDFADDLSDWRWEEERTVTDISVRAVRQFIRELDRDVWFYICPSDEGADVVLSALGGDFHVMADLGEVLEAFASNAVYGAEERARFRGILEGVLKVLG